MSTKPILVDRVEFITTEDGDQKFRGTNERTWYLIGTNRFEGKLKRGTKGKIYYQVLSKKRGLSYFVPSDKIVKPKSTWYVKGSKGDTYEVTLKDKQWYCDCPHSKFRHVECKHIKKIQEKIK